MTDPLVVQSVDGGLCIKGALGFATSVAQLRAAQDQVVSAKPSGGQLNVDLSALSHADSATLAILLAWSAHARCNNRSLRYAGVSGELKALATLADAGGLLDPP